MTDACTLWPEGWWSACCHAHDAAYGAGLDRWAADLDLLRCVAGSGDGVLAIASAGVAGVMFVGVRLFGRRFWRQS